MTVIIAMVPCLLFGIWNVGHQHFLAIGQPDAALGDKIGLDCGRCYPLWLFPMVLD
jgi:Na+-transporting NADH:ubiquinone oxidoreductase subunit B